MLLHDLLWYRDNIVQGISSLLFHYSDLVFLETLLRVLSYRDVVVLHVITVLVNDIKQMILIKINDVA